MTYTKLPGRKVVSKDIKFLRIQAPEAENDEANTPYRRNQLVGKSLVVVTLTLEPG